MEQSGFSSSNDSGCNSFGSEIVLERTEDRAYAVPSAETTASDARDGELSVNDSGYHHTLMQPVDFEAETHETGDQDDAKKATDDIHDVSLSASNTHSGTCTKHDSEISGPVVQRRASSSGRCQHGCATDGAGRREVVTRKLRRTSTMMRPPPQDSITRTRRRHSFMLPNGSDVYPARFSTGFAWPTIVEEDVQLTNDAGARQSSKKFRDADDEDVRCDSFAELRAFRATLNGEGKPADVDSGRADRGGFTIPESDRDRASSADFLALGTKLRGSLQLADGRVNFRRTPRQCEASISDVFDVDTFAGVNALGRATSRGETPSPSPPTTRRPPSYSEALLHKALRSSDLTQAESLTAHPYGLTAACSPTCRPPHTTHLLTSSTSGDVIVGAKDRVAGCRPPPPPYQLRPRPQNHAEGEIRNARNGGSVQRDAGLRRRKNRSEQPADRNSPDLQRSNSLPSPRRRRPAADAAAQKENVRTVASTAGAAPSPRSTYTLVTAAAPSPRSPAESVDATRKSWRNSVLLQRRSLTMKDRDWHRELVDQYSGGGTSSSVNVSATA